MSNTNDPNRLQSIAAAIYAAAAPVSMADHDKREAQLAADGAREAASNTREQVMGAIARLSTEGNWTEGEIQAATKLAASMGNAKDEKTLATFISETRRAAHPKARAWFSVLVQVRDQACDAEDEARKLDKGADCPVRKAFKRRYHTLVRMLGEAAEGNVLETAEMLVAFARANDPDLDIDKVHKRLQAIMGDLMEFANDFPDANVKEAAERLASVTKDDLKTARARKFAPPVTQPQPATQPQPKPAPVAQQPVVEISGEIEISSVIDEVLGTDPTIEPASGASDVLDDLFLTRRAA